MRHYKDSDWALTRGVVIGAAVMAVVMLSFPVVAAVGSNMILGKPNSADAVTSLSGAAAANLLITNTRAGAPALDLRVVAGSPPLKVNSTTRVPNLNADRLDGKHAGAFALVAHGHDGVYLPVGDQAADSALLNGLASSAFSLTGHDHDAAAISSGTLADSRYSAYGDLGVEGYLNNDAAGDLLTRAQADGRFLGIGAAAANSLLLGGLDSSSFSLLGHDHDADYLGIGATATNSDLLDGQQASAFAPTAHAHDAAAISSGTLADARFSAYGDLGVEGYLNNDAAGDLLTRAQADGRFLGIGATATNSDLLDGQQASAFSPTGHDHDASYVSVVAGATAGNFPILTAGGELASSAWGPASFAAAVHTHDASAITAGTLASDRYSAYSDLSAEGYLDLSASGDLLTRIQGDGRYLAIGGVAADSLLFGGMEPTAFSLASHDHAGAYLGIGAQAADSDLLDGLESSAFSPAGHLHPGVYLPVTGQAADADLLDGRDSTDFLGVGATAADSAALGGAPARAYLRGLVVAGSDGLPYLGNSCLWRGGFLLGFAADGSMLCTRPTGSGVFGDSGQALGSNYSYKVVLGDLNGDGYLDAFVANSGANQVWINDGAGNFTDSGQALGNSITYSVALGDLDGDGDLDAFETNASQPDRVWLNDGAGNFTDSGQVLGSAAGRDVALGDLDGDGDLDAFVVNDGQANRVWLNDGTGTFTDSGQAMGSATSRGVALGDLDGDGDLDAYVANNAQDDEVWLNDGAGTFVNSGQALVCASSIRVALADIDGDGDLDAHVAQYGRGNRVWVNDGTGVLTAGQVLGGSNTGEVAFGDLDGDGDMDVYEAVAGGANRVWLNDGTGTFTDSGQALGSSISNGVALGDLDGDGDLDAFTAESAAGGGPSRVWVNT